MSSPARSLLFTSLTVLIALAAGFVIVFVVVADPLAAYREFLTGPLQRLARVGRWLDVAANLTLLGLALVFTFRAHQFSLGASSQLLVGATCCSIAFRLLPAGTPTLLVLGIGILAAMAGGFLMGLLPGLLKAYLGASEVLTTLMLNAIVPLALGLLRVRGRSQEVVLPRISELTTLDTGTLHVGFGFAIIAVIATWIILMRTPFGYELRTIGANARFAHYGGINTQRAVALSFALGGALVALVGINLALGSYRGFGISVGTFTFDGIVVALLAGNNPLLVPLAALLYGYLLVGADVMGQQAAVGPEVLQVIQAVLIFLLGARAWQAARRANTATILKP